MDREILNLSGQWKLTYLDNKEVKEKGIAPRTAAEAEAIGKSLAAPVPGDFLLTLHKAGLLPDPYFGNNSWEYRKYEYTHVWYYTKFTLKEGKKDALYFDFEGLDTVCEIYLNGRSIGKTDNMFIPHRVKAEGIVQGENELVIHFIPVMLTAREKRLPPMCHTLFYSFEALYTRKPMHSYGWDIMPRILSCGIWKPVSLRERAEDSIEELHLFTLRTDAEKRFARVRIYFALSLSADNPREYRMEIDGKCGESVFHEECCPHHTEYTRLAFGLENAKLWWPKNHGEQNLYDVTARLWHGETLVDTKTMRFGIRSAELIRTDAIGDDGKGDFTFRINGRPIFCLGTNWVPMSPFHCEDEERLPRALALLDESGCNMVRAWGGSVYPSETFYRFCDEHGILVWQDFAMACAVYPQEEDFCRKIEEEATVIVKQYRHHPSLVLWAGDNECDATCAWNGFRRDPNDNILTRRILPDVVKAHDFTRPYLPSSPYVSPEAFNRRLPTPEAHLWDSDRYYFKKDYYKNAECYFASEIGYHGCPSFSSLKKFIGEAYLWPIEKEKGSPNVHWLAHTCEAQEDGELSYVYRAGLHQKEVKYLFGALPGDAKRYALLSQISQAEAFKFFVESFRAEKWRKTGILWWNLLDGWPQVSDAVIDFYYTKKMAFEYLKRSQQPVCLFFDEPCRGKMTLIGADDSAEDANGTYKVTDVTHGKIVASGKLTLKNNENAPIAKVKCKDGYAVYLIEWTVNGKTYRNHYTTGLVGMDADAYMADMKKCGFDDYTE